jgi:cephalosporin-C deacetylase-like acetyl esterase
MNIFLFICRLSAFAVLALAGSTLTPPASAEERLPDPPPMPADYYLEPANLPFDEKTVQEGVEAGWRWTEFHYTSLIYGGQPIRIHAVYAIPDGASAQNKTPAVVMTHGKFGQIMAERRDPRYWAAVGDLAKAGYAVLFYEWNPDPAMNWKPTESETAQRFSTFGTLDYSKEWRLPGNDWKDSLYYQAIMAGRRAVSWISTKPEVDASRVGLTGASFGGIFTSLLAAVEPRITTVAPTVYTAGFGPDEPGYNSLPRTWTMEQAQAWRARFDSEVLLKKRSLPILYTVSTNDAAFSVLKAMQTYREMPQPKHLLINPNKSHNDWNFTQTIRFFDHALRGKSTRPQIGEVELRNQDGTITPTVRSSAPKVEFFYALEPLPDPTQPAYRGNPAGLICKWKWIKTVAQKETGENYKAQISLTSEERAATRNLHIFALGTNESGVEECSPIVTLLIQP